MAVNGNSAGENKEMVTLTIDDQEVTVPKGTNLIEAAAQVRTEVPHYCYHPHLSVPGNCRMCQVEVEGAPKLMIGCHTVAQPGMVVRTHKTSKQVEDAQAATLEFILINHPLDCLVCDQAGQCKLQDYHYEYNARPSRFLEQKEHKVKAKPLGSTIILDGERCIACTRCIRFCDEITQTGELGLINRGDKVEIAVVKGSELENPFSGTVADLCPVGALTHRKWRFKSRVWFTNRQDSICPGCSTGCNVNVCEYDGQIVQVTARLNSDVNKEWLCDEGRYGFHRYLPQERLLTPVLSGAEVSWDAALKEAARLKGMRTLIVVAPDLMLEEYALVKRLKESVITDADVVIAYTERTLTDLQKILISPDYAPNFNGALYSGLLGEVQEPSDLEDRYRAALRSLSSGDFDGVLFVGDVIADNVDADLLAAQKKLSGLKLSAAIISDRDSALASAVQVALPARSVLEKSGLMVNRNQRLQYSAQVIARFPEGTEPAWRVLNRIAQSAGPALTSAQSDRDLTREYLAGDDRLQGLKIKDIKEAGVCLNNYQPQIGGKESAGEQAHTSA